MIFVVFRSSFYVLMEINVVVGVRIAIGVSWWPFDISSPIPVVVEVAIVFALGVVCTRLVQPDHSHLWTEMEPLVRSIG